MDSNKARVIVPMVHVVKTLKCETLELCRGTRWHACMTLPGNLF